MKKLNSRIVAYLCAMVFAACLFGCGKKSEGNVNTDISSLSQSSESATNKDLRVVSVAPNLTEIMFELDADEYLVGRSDYCDYPNEVKEITSVGNLYEPDIEKITELNPDLVIVSTHFNEENSKKLKELGINVLTLCEQENMEGIYSVIDTLGKEIGKEEEAEECIATMKSNISNIAQKVEKLDKPSVYYVVGYGEYGDYTATGDTYVSEMIELAGGNNIAKDLSSWTMSVETLIERDPDIILISDKTLDGTEDSAKIIDDFCNMEPYKNLTAVKNGNVYTIDNNMIDRQGVRNDDAIEIMAKIFHPEAF